MNNCADCRFYQAEVTRLQQAILKAVIKGESNEEIQALRDDCQMAKDELNEHQVLAHGVRGRDGR